MGAGKSSVGRRLALRLDVAFRDADAEIESAAGCTISQIFERYGEPAFRDGERKVIARLLNDEELRETLKNAKTAEEAYAAIKAREGE